MGASQYQTDGDSGLQLLGHRYYDPSIGRFLSQDPIQDGTNWYAYCDNNPLGETDPSGLEPPKKHDIAWHWIHDGDLMPPPKPAPPKPISEPIGRGGGGGIIRLIGGGTAIGIGLAAIGEAGESDLLTSDVIRHILDGDGQGNGGHGWRRGIPTKTEFPMPDEEVIRLVQRIVNDNLPTEPNPDHPGRRQKRRDHDITLTPGSPPYFIDRYNGAVKLLTVIVVLGQDGSVVTAYPENPRPNPRRRGR